MNDFNALQLMYADEQTAMQPRHMVRQERARQ